MFEENKTTTGNDVIDEAGALAKIDEVMRNVEDVLGELKVNDFVNYIKQEKLIESCYISAADIKKRLHNRATDIICDMIENVASISGLLDNMSHMYERIKNNEATLSEKKEASVVLNHGIETINTLMEQVTNLNDELLLMSRTIDFYHDNFCQY